MARRTPSPPPERRNYDRRMQAVYHEPDRRERERRAHWPKPKPRVKRTRWPLIVALLILLVLVDALAWDGYYLHAFLVSLNSSAGKSRSFTDNLWN